MSRTRGRRDEAGPLEHNGEPLHQIDPRPFLSGLPALSGTFTGMFYPGAAERLLEAMKHHPDYCSTCDGFPCQGGHQPAA